MGFPSRGVESSYRNSEADVYRFFQAAEMLLFVSRVPQTNQNIQPTSPPLLLGDMHLYR